MRSPPQMNEPHYTSPQDRPIEFETDDQLDRGPFVDSLVRALLVDQRNEKGDIVGRRSTGYVVGLTGRWGLGKSSVLNLLSEKLDAMDHVVVALFNPWLFRGRDELVAGFFNSLRTALGRSQAEEARALVKLVDRYWGAINIAGHGIAAAFDLQGGVGTATAGWKTWGPRLRDAIFKPEPRTPDEERLSLERKIAQAKCAVVVLIDELDRVEDDEVRAVAQLVKAVGDIKGLSYLVAYDPERVVQALGRGTGPERRESGERYLEKIIQHPIPLRPLFTEDTKALLQAAITNHDVTLEAPRTGSQRALFDHLVEVIETPREVKRLVGAFSVLERAVREEICPHDVLGYCWILTKAPGLRDRIAANIDHLVIDPSERGMADRVVRRMNKEAEPDFPDLLGEAATAHRKILKLLFPHVVDEAAPEDGERLSRRRNLVRMLYLGNPPGMIRRADVQALWSNPEVAALEEELLQLMNERKLASTIDRLDDLVASLPEAGDPTFWAALSRTFFRRSDWLIGPEERHALADDAATTLYRVGVRNPEQSHRLRTALDALIADGDLILVPWILRKHLFAHGLTKHESSRRGGEVLNLQETEDLLSRELPRYRTAVLDGTALRRLPTAEVIYVIKNSGHWDNELRASFTAQLDSIEAVSTLAALIVPPGHGVERASLDALFEADAVQARIGALVAGSGMPANPWLAESLQRLRIILAGGDPSFDTQ